MRFEQKETHVSRGERDQGRCVSAEEKLQHLGDQCLLLCGFYPEASREYGVARDEFVSMGAEAYKKLSSIEYGEDEIIYEYLAANFNEVAELLCYINDFSRESVRRQTHKTTKDYKDFEVSTNRTEQLPFSSLISNRVLN